MSNLTIQLSAEQTGFLAYLYPNNGPEDALINLLEHARKQAIRQVEKKIRVLYPGQKAEENQEETQRRPLARGMIGWRIRSGSCKSYAKSSKYHCPSTSFQKYRKDSVA